MFRIILVLLALLPVAAWSQDDPFGDCTTAVYLAQFDETSGRTGCDIRHSRTIQVHGSPVHLRIISLPGTSDREDSGWIPFIDQTFVNVGRQIEAMGTQAQLPNVTVMLRDVVGVYSGGAAHALTFWNSDLVNECPVSMFKVEGGVDTIDFAVAFAHELFHCVQRQSWNAARMPEAAIWWYEGSAAYFGSLAVSSSTISTQFAAEFGDTTMDHALFDSPSDYENIVFFDHLHQMRGAAGVATFLSAMPAEPNYLPVLASLFPLDDWAIFVEDYLQGLVQEPDGTPIRAPETTLNYEIEGDSGDIELVAKPYRAFRFELNFLSSADYELSVDLPENVRARMQVDNGPWQDFPQIVHACSADAKALVYLITTSEPIAVTLHYEKTAECSTCELVVEVDRCMVGTWEMTGGGPVEWMRAQGMGSNVRVETSQMSVMMTRSGGYILNPISVTLDVEGEPISGTGQSVDMAGQWAAADGTLYFCPQSGVVEANVQVEGGGFSMLTGPGGDAQAAYTCAGNTMTTTMEIGSGLPPMETTYTRVGR